MEPLLRSELDGYQPRRGKVRDVYDFGEFVLIVATDRISAFDVVMENGIPDKGRVLNQMSAYWFGRLQEVCRNHVITTTDQEIFSTLGFENPDLCGRMTLGVKTSPLAIECIARGYISGSLYKEYCRDGANVHGLSLPEDLQDGSKLDQPIFTPATKAEAGHDQNISFDQAAALVGIETAERARKLTIELYHQAAARAEEVGLILADTKFEFGMGPEGLTWIDEALTPDSSRYWEKNSYSPGRSQPSYDKQFVRDYLESMRWDKLPPGPRLPQQVVERTRQKYLEVFQRVTGTPLPAA